MTREQFIVPEDALRQAATRDGIDKLVAGTGVFQGNKILLLRRAEGDYLGGYYEIPGGRVDPGELIGDAAMRELHEETGLRARRLLGMFPGLDYSIKGLKVRQINFFAEVAPGSVQTNPSEHDHSLYATKADIGKIAMTKEMRGCVLRAFALRPR